MVDGDWRAPRTNICGFSAVDDSIPISCGCGCKVGSAFLLNDNACAKYRIDCSSCGRFWSFSDKIG